MGKFYPMKYTLPCRINTIFSLYTITELFNNFNVKISTKKKITELFICITQEKSNKNNVIKLLSLYFRVNINI